MHESPKTQIDILTTENLQACRDICECEPSEPSVSIFGKAKVGPFTRVLAVTALHRAPNS